MSWNNKNVLITGISGFVGAYLAEELIEQKANVYGLIRRRTDGSTPKNIKYHSLEGKFNEITGDLTDISSLEKAVNESQPDYVFHLAAQSFVPQSFDNPTDTETTNSKGTNNLL
ncbi:MAG TPA: NAD-dependent epimerase/dehydratase family protein, partial [Methanosphaera sp.]|nr:NAD-dependent epimerase/dehydratase family protein [Methanosphaera sp.]